MNRSDHKPIRSLLLTGDESCASFDEAPGSGADALFIDLEDPYVPFGKANIEKRHAEVRGFLEALPPGAPRPFVRINMFDTGRTLADLRAVMVPGLAGILLPHVRGPQDIIGIDAILQCMESDLGLPVGGTLVIPILEEAKGMASVRQIAEASQRVNYMGPIIGPTGDTPNALKYRMSASGEEVAPLMSRSVVDARAGGVTYPVGLCLTLDYAKNAETMRAGMERMRAWGYSGTVIWNVSQVGMAHEVFSPSREDIERWSQMVELFDAAAEADQPVRLPADLLSRGFAGATASGFVRPYVIDAARQGLEYARALGLVSQKGVRS